MIIEVTIAGGFAVGVCWFLLRMMRTLVFNHMAHMQASLDKMTATLQKLVDEIRMDRAHHENK